MHAHAIYAEIHAIWLKIACACNLSGNAILSCRVSFNSSGLEERCPLEWTQTKNIWKVYIKKMVGTRITSVFFQKIGVNTKICGRSSKIHENSQWFLGAFWGIYLATCSSTNYFEEIGAFQDTLMFICTFSFVCVKPSFFFYILYGASWHA